MTLNRWTHALETGAFELPEGLAFVADARADGDYGAFAQVHLQSRFAPDYHALAARGLMIDEHDLAPAQAASALVQIVKSKPRALARIASAYEALLPGGLLLVDGQKTDGIESILKALRARLPEVAVLSKHHGKLLWARKTDAVADLNDWFLPDIELEGGYRTQPGLFSADGPDPGSELLIALVPQLAGRIADFGSGWGYMGGEILKEQAGITQIDMIEADRNAMEYAEINVADPRARHIWGDVTRFAPDQAYDAIISNPPFHTGRAADPDLGRAFIAAAARNLTAKGKFYMVANRHLPYEAALKAAFGTGRMLAEMHGYKLYEAAKPLKAAGSPHRR